MSLRYSESQQQRVRAARERAQERDGRERQREREEEGEEEECLPSDGVTGRVKSREVQTEVAQHVDRDEQPESVRYEAQGNRLRQQTEPAQNVEQHIRREPTCSHRERLQFILRVNHRAHDDDITVKEGREHDQHQ